LDYAIELLIKVAVTVVLVLIVCLFIIGIHINHGNSSYPMIKDGDLVITFRLSDLKQGDEVGYTVDGQFKLGRVVAVGGDEVDINDSFVSVNGFGIAEDVVYPTSSSGAKIQFPYQVPEGSVFVLNDFRSDNEDSRNSRDFTDPYSVIYGHHMQYGKMFGALDDFLDEDYLARHNTGKLMAGKNADTVYDLKVLCAISADAKDEIVFDIMSSEEVKAVLAEKGYNEDKKILGLVTCTDADSTERTIVFAYILDN